MKRKWYVCVSIRDFQRFLPCTDVVVFLTTVPRENFSGLKPSTLKQLGQTVPITTNKQVNAHTHTHTMETANMQIWSIILTFCMSSYRNPLSQQMEDSLWVHRLTGEWTSCQLCPSNKNTPFPALSVYSVYYFSLCSPCWISLLFLEWRVILVLLYSCRIWDCPQHEEEAAVRTRPVTTCIIIDTNLLCALNVALSWPRKTPREQRWKLTSSRFFSSKDMVGLVSSCISQLLTRFMSLSTTSDPWAVASYYNLDWRLITTGLWCRVTHYSFLCMAFKWAEPVKMVL